MRKTLPLRIFYPLSEMESLWRVAPADLHQWLEHGFLKAHFWIPMSSLYEIEEEVNGNQIIQTRVLCHREGYLKIFPHDCQRLFLEGQTLLREFGGDSPGKRYGLPDNVPSLPVRLENLVILTEERIRFEESYQIPQIPPGNTKSISNQPFPPEHHRSRPIEPIFRKVRYQGKLHTFGTLQATIIGILYQAAQEGRPWINGKQLLAEAGSLSFSVSNLFKRKPVWRSFITSDSLGNYRIDQDFFQFRQENEGQ
jgi:hypothetical protein